MSDETSKTLGLFDAAPAAVDPDMGRQPVADLWPTVALAGRWVDFRAPAAPRRAVEIIVGLATKAERAEALDMVPLNFRGMVKIMVERAFYNQKRERALAAR